MRMVGTTRKPAAKSSRLYATFAAVYSLTTVGHGIVPVVTKARKRHDCNPVNAR
jgi:hypothetical protein